MSTDRRAASSNEPSGTGVLRPKARLLRTLGSDLISSDKVALIELVKNSYDADANIVIIRFCGPLDKGAGRIEVWDDGHGMTASTLQESWLNIANDLKEKHPRSAKGRRVLGEKGIGRLAAARLGQEMLLTTRMDGNQEVQLLINWTDFDRDDAFLDEIEVAWDVATPRVFSGNGTSVDMFSKVEGSHWSGGHGTVVQVDRLSRTWGKKDLLELSTALTRLVRPRPNFNLKSIGSENVELDFQVFIELVDVGEEFENLGGKIEPAPELRTPHYSIFGSVDSCGAARLYYKQQDYPASRDIGLKQLWVDGMRAPQAGPFDIEISVWDLDKDAMRRTIQQSRTGGLAPSTQEINEFREILGSVAGISIYRDGFRVLPYGENGDDWLGLDLRRVQSPTRRVSNNQVVGHVFIGADSNKELKDQSNREGILDGVAYSDLQTLVKAILNELEVRRYKARRKDRESAKENRGGLFSTFDLGGIHSALSQSYPQDKHLIGLVDSKNQEIKRGVAEMQNVLSQYSRLATLGTLIERVLHDGRTVLTRLKNISRFGERDLNRKTYTDDEKVRGALKAMSDSLYQTDLLDALFKQIEPFGGRKRGRPKQINVSEVIAKSIAILQQEANDCSVELNYEERSIEVKIDEAELLVVLVNLIKNAIYWTSTLPVGRKRRVIVDSRLDEDSSLCIVVSDSGPGVSVDVRDCIFDPYFSSKPDGVGLGLSIAGNIVEHFYDGRLILAEGGPLSGATFEATFRKRVK